MRLDDVSRIFFAKKKAFIISQTINEVKKSSFFKLTFQTAISKLAFTLCSNLVQFFKTQSCIKKVLLFSPWRRTNAQKFCFVSSSRWKYGTYQLVWCQILVLLFVVCFVLTFEGIENFVWNPKITIVLNCLTCMGQNFRNTEL